MLSRIVLRTGLSASVEMSVDNLKKSIVRFKQLRSLELSYVVSMSDFALWEVVGTLPSLANFTLAIPPEALAHAPENSNSRSGGPKYFEALESLCVAGSVFFIQHLLRLIDSPCLKSIEVFLNRVRTEHVHEDNDRFISFITVVASKWSQSLKNLDITTIPFPSRETAVSKCLMLLTDLHEMQTFDLMGMTITDDDVRRLVMSWSKLRTLSLDTFISLSTLRIIAENCPELRHLLIELDTSTIPPFDTSSKSLHHNLEILTVAGVHPSNTQTTLKCQIQVSRYLDLIFPYLKRVESIMQREEVFWLGISDLVELCQDARRVK
jgi:hypothetical protein